MYFFPPGTVSVTQEPFKNSLTDIPSEFLLCMTCQEFGAKSPSVVCFREALNHIYSVNTTCYAKGFFSPQICKACEKNMFSDVPFQMKHLSKPVLVQLE